MARVNHQRLRFGWDREIKRLAASGEQKKLSDLVDFIKENVDQIGAFDRVWNGILVGAIQRSIPVEITKPYALDLFREQEGRCAISRIAIGFQAPGKFVGARDARTASLDRIDSDLGYIPGNVWWVHRDINQMKMSQSLARFVALCRAVVETADAGGMDRATASLLQQTLVPRPHLDTTSVVSAFVEACCQDEAGADTPADALWSAFQAWIVRESLPAVSQTAFGRALSGSGYAKTRGHTVRYHGLSLLPEAVPAGEAREGREGAQTRAPGKTQVSEQISGRPKKRAKVRGFRQVAANK